jgi:hypothetical protein
MVASRCSIVGTGVTNYRLIRGEVMSLRARVDTLASLDRIARDGVKASPTRGLEVGGLLEGAVGDEIRLETIRPLPAGYRSSAAFCPSPADLLFIRLWAQAPATNVVGHFRTQTSGELEPIAADRVIADLLNVPHPLLLLISVSDRGVEEARMYRRENGDWGLLLTFPLIESSIGQNALQKSAGSVPVEWVKAAKGPRWRRWALGGLAVGVACGAFLSHSIWQPGPSDVLPVRSDIKLELHSEGTRLKVQWNPSSRSVAEASSGTLKVQDGGQHLEIPLDRQQLNSGGTFYYPQTGSVEVRLEIYRDGNHFTGESAALTTGLSAPPAAKNSTESLQPVVEEAREKPAAIPLKKNLAAPTPHAALPPPVVLAKPPVAPPKPSAIDSTPPPAFPDEPPVRYETAVAIRETRPTVPAELYASLSDPISIEIEVKIDTAGKVVSATPVGNLTAVQKLLADRAVDAARLWRFEPARKNGEAVESESLLKFDFGPSGH